MNWLLASIAATLLLSVYPIFADRAGKIHGERMNFVIDTLVMLVISSFLSYFYKGDFAKITRVSFRYGLGIGFSGIAFLLILYSLRIAPEKIPIIMVIIGFSTVLTALIYACMGTKLSVLEWICISGATFFISALCLIQKRV